MSQSPRIHFVLVPGFAGFDALGQIRYYAGVTDVFRQWRSRRTHPTGAGIHYFDNLPTAAVRTRAHRLAAYLAKRVARGEFESDDTVALIGHSTGGLDIRQMLWMLAESPTETISVDAGSDVTHGEVLQKIRRIVFLSVPQFGTNIANWVLQRPTLRRGAIDGLRLAIEVHPLRAAAVIDEFLTRVSADAMHADLLLAAHDALVESDVGPVANDPILSADAREAYSELCLWLRHIDADFDAIKDLAVLPIETDPSSPAHFDNAQRTMELAHWRSHDIEAQSYATIATCPFDSPVTRNPREWMLANPMRYPDVGLAPHARAKTDVMFRACYRACLAGPFSVEGSRHATWLTGERSHAIADYENDGIVNTGSMLWPNGAATKLVAADHGDIIGHFLPSDATTPRRAHERTYDLLRSNSGFERTMFEHVWHDVFDFAAGRT